jgi:hypothetical protein
VIDEARELHNAVVRALAFAHAAVDEPSAARVLAARSQAQALLPRLDRLRKPAFTLSQASRIVVLVSQLRAVLEVLDRRLHPHAKPELPS